MITHIDIQVSVDWWEANSNKFQPPYHVEEEPLPAYAMFSFDVSIPIINGNSYKQ